MINSELKRLPGWKNLHMYIISISVHTLPFIANSIWFFHLSFLGNNWTERNHHRFFPPSIPLSFYLFFLLPRLFIFSLPIYPLFLFLSFHSTTAADGSSVIPSRTHDARTHAHARARKSGLAWMRVLRTVKTRKIVEHLSFSRFGPKNDVLK